ncbi:urotensin-2 [Artibeus jamaicensis]|uniref:urotensin-2 n=1 Tax=Artibeus jamaicensis TaxID=9417 RepID=UPI00235B1023|nr:urotensin-2 [Artibeus jamaicensis]
MYKLASCCLLLLGCLNSLFSFPTPDSRDEPLQLLAPDGGVRPTLDKGDRASLLHELLVALGAETGDGLRKAGKRILAFSGQGPNILLNHLWARIRKQDKRGHPSECFWKYCV